MFTATTRPGRTMGNPVYLLVRPDATLQQAPCHQDGVAGMEVPLTRGAGARWSDCDGFETSTLTFRQKEFLHCTSYRHRIHRVTEKLRYCIRFKYCFCIRGRSILPITGPSQDHRLFLEFSFGFHRGGRDPFMVVTVTQWSRRGPTMTSVAKRIT